MKLSSLLLACLLAWPFFSDAAQPSEVVITTVPGINVKVTRNKTNTSKQIAVTVNKDDKVLIKTFEPTTPPVPPKPADETQQVACPVGSVVGSTWTQTRTYTLVNNVWVPGPWMPTSPPQGACPAAPMPPMHGGIQGILWDNPIIASSDGIAFAPGIDYSFYSGEPHPFGPPPPVEAWEQPGAVRQVCKTAGHNNDDPIVYPGTTGLAHDHTHFRPDTTAFLTNANVRNLGNRSTCRGGTLDLTGRWVPTMYNTVDMRAVVPQSLIVYYKTTMCNYSIMCSGSATYTRAPLMNISWVPKGFKIIAGDPGATAPNGRVHYSCEGPSGGTLGGDTIPKCPEGETLWMKISFPQCLATTADGKPILDSPDHKSHAAYMQGWPEYNSPLPGKAYNCPPSHPFSIPDITFNVLFYIGPGMDSSKWNLSCGTQYCAHGDWFDGWDQNVMLPTHEECIRNGRDCGSFMIFDGRTVGEFGGN